MLLKLRENNSPPTLLLPGPGGLIHGRACFGGFGG